jgi:hypothetical protein
VTITLLIVYSHTKIMFIHPNTTHLFAYTGRLNDSLEKKNFHSMSHAVERNTTLDEYWEIVKIDICNCRGCLHFLYSVRKQEVRHAKH